MSYIVAIPSHMRWDLLPTATLKMLARGGVPKERIHIFTPQPEEYERTCSEYPIHRCPVGIGNARNCIRDHFPSGVNVLQLDDDIDFEPVIYAPSRKERTRPLRDGELTRVIEYGFQICRKENALLWSINWTFVPMYFKWGYTTHWKKILGAWMGEINSHDPTLRSNLPYNEDLESAALKYLRCRKHVVITFIGFIRTLHRLGGGVEGQHTREEQELYLRYLLERYPDLFYLNKRLRGRQGQADIDFKNPKHNWKKNEVKI